jgi:hypothetical protein
MANVTPVPGSAILTDKARLEAEAVARYVRETTIADVEYFMKVLTEPLPIWWLTDEK